MRRETQIRLAQPYSDGPKPSRSVAFHHAIGLHIPKWRSFAEAFAADRGEVAGEFGVTWWRDYAMDQTTRILISDYTIQCLHAVQTNLIEALLHLSGWEGAVEARTAHFDRAAKAGGKPVAPASLTPMDDVNTALIDLHTAGVMRAVGSTLDCAAVAAAVVAAVPVPLIKLDFRKLTKHLSMRSKESAGAGVARPLETQLHDAIEEATTRVGPLGWLDWSIDLRNLFVHRGRRTSIDQTDVDAVLVDVRGRPIPRVSIVRRLPRSPERSDMEMFRDFSVMTPVLTEDASETLHGVVQSVVALVEALGDVLLTIWGTRRCAPGQPEQPVQQWSDRAFDQGCFDGYAPGSKPFRPTSFHTSKAMSARMKAAAMLDGQRESVWKRVTPKATTSARPQGSP